MIQFILIVFVLVRLNITVQVFIPNDEVGYAVYKNPKIT